jgi:hypothetical protein
MMATLTTLASSFTRSLPLWCSIDSVQQAMALLRTNIPFSCQDCDKIHKLLSIEGFPIGLWKQIYNPPFIVYIDVMLSNNSNISIYMVSLLTCLEEKRFHSNTAKNCKKISVKIIVRYGHELIKPRKATYKKELYKTCLGASLFRTVKKIYL